MTGLFARLFRRVRVRSRTATPQPLREAAPADISRLLRLEDEGERTLALSRRRLSIIGVCFAAGFALIGFRAVVLAASHDPDQVFIAAAAAPDAPNRGDILDRDGEILAATLDFHSVYADPKYVWDAEIAAARLTTVLPQLDAETLRRDLDSNRRFVWVARGLTPRQRQAIHLLGLPGIGFVEEPGRIYPKRRAAAHLVGYADRDLHGLSGAELAFDAALSAGDGRPVSLSIDLTAQHAVESVLRARMAHFRAEGASAVLMRVGTGEILALASLPDFDPNRPNDAPNSARFNRASEGVYELGSVFKPLTLAAALESGAVALDDVFDATDPISIGGFRIRDFHPERRPMTAREAVIHSSNIATARMAETLDGVRLRQFFQDLRLLERAPVELAESGRPLTPAAPWSTIETMTISYGHGMAISPLALTAAYAALANGGVYTPPTLRPVAPGEIIVGEPVMSAETSAAVLAVMRQVVTQGSGRRADVDGLAVAGKTGTAERVVGGRYDTDSLFTSFVSIFPFDDPEYVLLVSFDRPKAAPETHGFATAGWNAAPTSGEMIMRLSSILGVELRETDPQARASAVAMMFAPRARTRARPEEPLLLNPLAPEDVSGE